jgi:hypothetical protein
MVITMERGYSIAFFVLLVLCALVFFVYNLIMWALTFCAIALVVLVAYAFVSRNKSSEEPS